MAASVHAIERMVDHAHDSLGVLEKLPDLNLIVDEGEGQVTNHFGTDGETDIVVFNGDFLLPSGVNGTVLFNFDVGEDLLLFINMDGRDVDISGNASNSFVTFSDDNGRGAGIIVVDVPYQEIHDMVLAPDAQLVFHDPFAIA